MNILRALVQFVKHLNFTDKPSQATLQLPDEEPIEGTSYTMTCDVNGGRPNPGANNYTWWKDGGEPLGEDTNTLTQTLKRGQHEGTYTCAASNYAGSSPTSQGEGLPVYCEYIDYNIMNAAWMNICKLQFVILVHQEYHWTQLNRDSAMGR